jgi:hypothetical protein
MSKGTMTFPFLIFAAMLFMVSCAGAPDVIGKWREIGKPGTIEFFKDGTFRAVDNQGMAAGGTYTLDKDGNMVFEIAHRGSSPEVVRTVAAVKKRELTLVFPRTDEVLRYMKED